MLTFILLVVLAGGVGLAAVSAAERNDPTTPRVRTRRGPRPSSDERDRPTIDTTEATRPPSRGVRAPASARTEPLGRPTRTVRVRKSQTAVEGAFDVVALRTPARRLASLGLMLLLAIAVAVVITAGIGLAAGAIWRVLDSAIG